MVKLLIPTRNRPTSLSHVLGYLARYYRKTEVVIADGSVAPVAEANRRTVARFSNRIPIAHHVYPAELPMVDRMLDVLRRMDDDVVAMGSDDDYPLMDTLRNGQAFLQANPDFVTAMGASINLNLWAPGRLIARLGPARQIADALPLRRARQFAGWPFPTSYAVTRRAPLLERFERARTMLVAGFYDFTTGLHETMLGKIKAMPTIGYICTRNYGHSYLRPEGGLAFLRKGQQILEIADQIRRDLVQYGGLDNDAAQRESEALIKKRIAQLIGVHVHHQAQFEERFVRGSAIVQKQFELFHATFADDNPTRARYIDKLNVINRAIQDNAQSGDNKGEKRHYDTLEEMASAAPAGNGRGAHAPSNGQGGSEPGTQGDGSPGAEPAKRPFGGRNASRGSEMIIHVDPQTLLRID